MLMEIYQKLKLYVFIRNIMIVSFQFNVTGNVCYLLNFLVSHNKDNFLNI